MLQVTDAATEHLNKLLGDSGAPDEAAIRVVVEERGLTLRLDNVRPGDSSFEHDGKTVLVLDEQVSQMLDDKTMDIEETGEGPRLAIV